jgi:hypothetical protein
MNIQLRAATSPQTYARAAGVLLLISFVAGGLGEFYIPGQFVSHDAATTASNIVAHTALFRWGFATYLIEAICDILLSWVFYVLLRPVHKHLALLAAFIGLVSTAVFAGGELWYYAASVILNGSDYLKSFTPAQLNTLSLLALRLYATCSGIFLALYGSACAVRGYLIMRSSFLPKSLGVLLLLAGAGFIINNFLLLLAPSLTSNILIAPMPLAVISMTVWLLVRGVDREKWTAEALIAD